MSNIKADADAGASEINRVSIDDLFIFVHNYGITPAMKTGKR